MHHRPHIWFATLWRWHKINGNFDDHNDAKMGCNQCVTNLVPGWLQPRQATLHLDGGCAYITSSITSSITSYELYCSNMISAPWLQHKNQSHPTTGTQIAKDWWLVWGHGDLRDQIDGQGRTISACSTLLQTYANMQGWSTIGQNPYISASFEPFSSLPFVHKILAFYWRSSNFSNLYNPDQEKDNLSV